MPISRLGHINVQTPLFEETLAFYETALGLHRGLAASVFDQKCFAWLYDDGGRAVIHVNAPPPGDPGRQTGIASRLDHVAFDCTEADAFAERLRTADIPFSSTDSEAGKLRQYVLHDPNGLKIELTFQL